ncbi:MAG: hypothetical protein WD398_14900 [Cyclobacteriaceae bacterium]
MKFKIKIKDLSSVDEIPSYWTEADYIILLEKMDFPGAKDAKKENLRELLMMAITDFEPSEAAAIILDYKLSEQLNEGQIQQISHDMLIDKIAEEYPKIELQATLYHINQLLYKAFNGKFPNTKASIIEMAIQPIDEANQMPITKEMVLKLLSPAFSDRNLIKRLFGEKLESDAPFEEAEGIVWDLKSKGSGNYELLTSSYWIGEEDIVKDEYEAEWSEEEEDE